MTTAKGCVAASSSVGRLQKNKGGDDAQTDCADRFHM
jgi:hypothetical protein